MNADMLNEVADCIESLNVQRLEEISQAPDVAQSPSLRDLFLGLRKSLTGDNAAALDIYQRIDPTLLPQPLRYLHAIESFYLTGKVVPRADRPARNKLLTLAIGISFSVRHKKFRRLLLTMLFSEWYASMFRHSHAECLMVSSAFLIYGFFSGSKSTLTHAMFLQGHQLCCMGFTTAGSKLIESGCRNRHHVTQLAQLQTSCFIPYSIYLSGRNFHLVPPLITAAEQALTVRPDPFYKTIFWMSGLHYFSQLGDIERSEEYAQRLINLAKATGFSKFHCTATANLALCYAVRGHLSKCRMLLSEIKPCDEASASHLELGIYFRLRALTSFYLKDYRAAHAAAEQSLREYAKSHAFHLAVSMTKLLRRACAFRITMEETEDSTAMLKVLGSHLDDIKRFGWKARKNQIASGLIQEELRSCTQALKSTTHAGIYRSENVEFAQRELFSLFTSHCNSDEPALMGEISRILDSNVGVTILSNKSVPPIHASGPRVLVMGQSVSMTFMRGDTSQELVLVPTSGDVLASQVESMYCLSPVIQTLLTIRDQEKALVKAENTKALGDMASQVAHDIRSPLAALNIFANSMQGLDQKSHEMVLRATGRISDIANNLLAMKKPNHSDAGVRQERSPMHLAAQLVEELVAEKRVEFSKCPMVEITAHVACSASMKYIAVDESEFKSSLSNLINNAFDALDGAGSIAVTVSGESGRVCIRVTDTGRGIPAEILEKIGQRGFTYGKKGGNGLGVADAKQKWQDWNGDLNIHSAVGMGTTVTLTLPCTTTPAPEWNHPLTSSKVSGESMGSLSSSKIMPLHRIQSVRA